MAVNEKRGKLVGFLGTGPKDGGYVDTVYSVSGKKSRKTRFISLALAELYKLGQVTLFCTPESALRYQKEIEAAAHNLNLRFLPFPIGRNETELKEQMKVLVPELLDESADPLYLDITHGFRSFPFFASSLLAFAASLASENRRLRVVYGAYEAATSGSDCPVWDLSHTLTAYRHGFELSTFMKSGRLSPTLPRQLEDLAKQLKSTKEPSKELQEFASSIRAFAGDFATIRVGPLLLGGAAKEFGSAVRLRNAIHQSRSTLLEHFPMIGSVLSQIETQIAPLTHLRSIPHLATLEGLRCSLGLAQLYWDCERYSECAVVAREMAVDLYCEPHGASPGYRDFDGALRETARGELVRKDKPLSRALNRIRNDIEHGGYDNPEHMKTPSQIRDGLKGIIGMLRRCVEAKET